MSMQLPVLVETVGQGRYRAEAFAPLSVSAEGNSSGEAVQNLRVQIAEMMAQGKQIVMLEMPAPGENPWVKYAGHLKDDPMLAEYQAAVAEYRRQRDAEDDAQE
jgi:hypothetical protein